MTNKFKETLGRIQALVGLGLITLGFGISGYTAFQSAQIEANNPRVRIVNQLERSMGYYEAHPEKLKGNERSARNFYIEKEEYNRLMKINGVEKAKKEYNKYRDFSYISILSILPGLALTAKGCRKLEDKYEE